MSLFGSMMGDFEEDPFFGAQSRVMNQMNSMVNSFFSDPFGDMMEMGFPGPMMGGPPMLPQLMAPRRPRGRGELMPMPFGFPGMPAMPMFPPMDRVEGLGNCHSFSSSSMVSMTTGPDGRPQVYQASSSTRTAPGGVRETKKAVTDSRSGTKKMAIGHHIGERAHIIEKEQNVYTGNQEERQELINLEEEETPVFNREWESRTRRAMGGIAIEDVTDAYPSRSADRQLLALPSSSTSARSRARAHVSSSSAASPAAGSHERPRKRDHGTDGSSSRKSSKQQRGRRGD